MEGVKAKLGFRRVYIGEEIAKYPLELKKFSTVVYDAIPDEIGGDGADGSLRDLIINEAKDVGLYYPHSVSHHWDWMCTIKGAMVVI